MSNNIQNNIQLYIECTQYYPGDTIRGQVVCQFRNSEDIRKIRIRFKGSESTKWTEGSGTSRTTYTGHRTLFFHDRILQKAGKVEAGEYAFQYQFIIPQNIPSSFEHQNGNIRYSVKVTVDRPWAFDYENKREVIIASLIKLQDISPSLQESINLSDEKTICCFCCASGNIQLDINVEKRAFKIGENVNFVASCTNMSNTRVMSLAVYLNLKLTFKAQTLLGDVVTRECQTISASIYDGVEAHSETTTQLGFLISPSTMIPNFNGSALFSCTPQLQFRAVIFGCHTDLVLKTKVALYHVHPQASPVISQNEQTAPSNSPDRVSSLCMLISLPMQANSSTRQEMEVTPSKSNDEIGTLASPPTYEEATKKST